MAEAFTLIKNNHILLIALDSVQIVHFCNHMLSVQLLRNSSMLNHLVPVKPQNLIRIMKAHTYSLLTTSIKSFPGKENVIIRVSAPGSPGWVQDEIKAA